MEEVRQYNVLVPVALPSAGPGLVRAAAALVPPGRDPALCVLHVERVTGPDTSEREREEIAELSEEALAGAVQEAAMLGLPMRTCTVASDDRAGAIADMAESESANLIVMGWTRALPGGRIPSSTVDRLMERCTRDVAVLLDRRQPPWRSVLLPFAGGPDDLLAVSLVRRIARSGAEVTILHVVDPDRPAGESPRLRTRETGSFRDERVTLEVVQSNDTVGQTARVARRGFDLIVVGAAPAFQVGDSLWGEQHERIARECDSSVLVVRSHLAVGRQAEEALSSRES